MSMRAVKDFFIADTARVVGEVSISKDANLWYGVAIRGDVAPITIGQRTNVQDNVVIHCDKGHPNIIGNDVTIGHGAIVHGIEVGDGSMIGMGAIVLGGSRIGKGSIVAAGALVPQGMEVPDGHVAMGVPAKVVRETNDHEKKYLADIPPRYVEIARLHAEGTDPRVLPVVDPLVVEES